MLSLEEDCTYWYFTSDDMYLIHDIDKYFHDWKGKFWSRNIIGDGNEIRIWKQQVLDDNDESWISLGSIELIDLLLGEDNEIRIN